LWAVLALAVLHVKPRKMSSAALREKAEIIASLHGTGIITPHFKAGRVARYGAQLFLNDNYGPKPEYTMLGSDRNGHTTFLFVGELTMYADDAYDADGTPCDPLFFRVGTYTENPSPLMEELFGTGRFSSWGAREGVAYPIVCGPLQLVAVHRNPRISYLARNGTTLFQNQTIQSSARYVFVGYRIQLSGA
jgi:hypothetical protein